MWWLLSSQSADSVVVGHGPSCPVACGIFPDQGWKPSPLLWQADSYPLHHRGSPNSMGFDNRTVTCIYQHSIIQSFFTAFNQCWRQGVGETGRVISDVEAMREKWLLKEGRFPVSSLVSGVRFKLAQLGTSPSKVSMPASSSIHLVLIPSSFSLTPTCSACFQRESAVKMPVEIWSTSFLPAVTVARVCPAAASSQHSQQAWLPAVKASDNWVIFLNMGLTVYFYAHTMLV